MIELGHDLVEPEDSRDSPPSVAMVLEAIDRLLDAMEGFEAPITRELLGSAMMALVHECGLGGERGVVN
jgi:hypothetical protein